MTDEDYLDLARFIRAQLAERGFHDIAEFSDYTDDDDEERPTVDGKTLVKLMLGAFRRYLVANASETVEVSLGIIRDAIDEGERPRSALVHLGDERAAAMEGREIAEPVSTLGNMSEVQSALTRLEELLHEDPEPSEPDQELL